MKYVAYLIGKRKYAAAVAFLSLFPVWAFAATLTVTPTSISATSDPISVTISPETSVFYWGVYDIDGNMTDIVNVSNASYEIFNPIYGSGHPVASGHYHILLIDSSQSGWPNNCDGLSPYTGTYSSCKASAGYAGVDYDISVGTNESGTTTPLVIGSTNTIVFLYFTLGIYLVQVLVYALILFIVFAIAFWPMKILFRSIVRHVNLAGRP